MRDVSRELADAWLAAWTRSGAFASLATPDVQYEDPVVPEPLRGAAALDAHAERVRIAFPDLRLERSGPALADATHACVPWRALGTHRGELGPLPPSGRFAVVHGVHYLELADGAVRRARGFFDLYGTAVQLGLLPARGGLAEAVLLAVRGFGLRRLT